MSLFTNLPVFIQTPNGTTFFLETQPSYTIRHIKAMIKEKKRFLPDGLKLKLADQVLEDGHTLSDYNIQDGSTLHSYIGRMDVCVQTYASGRSRGGVTTPTKAHSHACKRIDLHNNEHGSTCSSGQLFCTCWNASY